MSAYGHALHSGPLGHPVRIDNEQFSTNRVDTDGFVTIKGTVVNRSEQQFELSPYIFAQRTDVTFSGDSWRGEVPPYEGPLRVVYPPYRDTSSWYFEVEHSLPSPLVLQSGDRVDFEIKVYPIKAGVYHIHSYFVAEKGAFIGRGQTVVVGGSTAPTNGEIGQLYLPFALGVAAAAVLMPRAVSVSRKSSRAERVARIFFAAKASFETIWLSGVLLWLSTTSYFAPLEARYAFMLLATATLASITFGGYVASIARPRIRYMTFAVGTSAATAVFYFVLAFGNLFDAYKTPLFVIDGLVSLIAIIANVLMATYVLILLRRERARISQTNHFARS